MTQDAIGAPLPRAFPILAAAILLAPLAATSAEAETLELGPSVVMRAAAVSEGPEGFVGSTATITITSAANGSGHVFLDTFPLTEVDMQGSARLAARVAAQMTGKDLHNHDFFFVVRSGAEQIGGPSAGAAMTVGAIASLNHWSVRDDALMTGTINPDGTVGPVGGIAQKAAAAAQAGVTRFLFPAGQEVVPLDATRVVNMTAYCAEELKIDCLPVADVIDAVGLMTDHVIERQPVGASVTGDDFRNRLGPLGAELIADAQERLTEAEAAHAALAEGAAKASLSPNLALARSLLDDASAAVANGSYYTAASLSFQSSIQAHYVREASAYVAATDRPAALASTLARSRTLIDEIAREIEQKPVDDTNSFEAVGAAQVRILEAESRLEDATVRAQRARTDDAILGAIHQASYAAERGETARWWLQLAEGFPKGERVAREPLEEIARDTITTSKEEVTYVEAVFQNAGALGQLNESRELLDKADRAMERGFYAAGMLNALEASVRASVRLQIASFGGSVPNGTIETARENAARAIQGARARGVESILAQSAYEFGLSLEEADEKLSFLGVARVTGNLAGLPGLFNEAAPPTSRFQGIPPTYRVEAVYVAAAFAVGIALGVGAGLTALMPRKPEEEEWPKGPRETEGAP